MYPYYDLVLAQAILRRRIDEVNLERQVLQARVYRRRQRDAGRPEGPKRDALLVRPVKAVLELLGRRPVL